MAIINIGQAKTTLSRLVERAAAGEDIIIARRGKPVARLTRLAAPKRGIRFGVLRGKIKVADDFDAPLPQQARAAFEGR
ncbi:MAG: type II toxin-antitoxin system Phd/YefM family antitoxin [Gammaproteobacteria bacterium]|nr:MAG: type II toxin-antitoxin system Phd/YefM family antitoxin [Gammaproteobacteria bacterium]